ncbi:diguanylate cyclase [Massilia sp. GCM10023247]|uniref:diguanylate cyclase n=1 Tax=Massilia sp. GCM10023247 TaxID=3252643 RepID=UPI00360EC96C
MNSTCARWSDRYLVATHWFIPADVLNGPAAARSRAENVVNATLLAGTAGPFYALAYFLLGFPAAGLEILLCCLCMLAAPLLLRATGSVRAARELFLCALFFNFTWLSYYLGGIGAPTASWLITPPLVAMFLGGVGCALSWLALSCVAAIAIYALPGAGHALPVHPVSDMALLYLACHLGLFVVVLVFALLVEMTKTQGFVKLEQALGTINELALRDELTGVHNRRYLMGLIEKEKERADRNGRAFCLCLLDIDFFKRVNDTYGHSAGDAVLRAVARTVEAQVRGSDCFGRYGGEEFLLMLPETPAADALVLTERVREAIEKLRCLEAGSEIALTVSIGVAEYRMGEAIGLSVGRADEALYLAKSSGRNRVVCHGENREPLALALRDSAPGIPDEQDLGASVGRMLDSVHCDQLTGLLNRRLLRDRLRHAMDRADRNRRLVALLLLNINGFKEVNDAHGYEAGDALLVQVGAMIRHCLRDCDTVARWSGDEFVALLEDLGGEGDARRVAEKILDGFGLPLTVAERECFITLSVGVALYPAADCDLDALLKRADIAMRSARAWGENSVQLYSSAVCEPRSERLALKNGLRDALARGQLFLEYQPQVDLATRRIVGVEALLRWQHPVYGRIDPGRFIPLAEETGMIVPIGDWVLRTACAQNRAWRDAGLPGVKTAVNLSARQLRVPKIAARVMEIVGASGLPCGCLDLEITEGVLIDDLEANRKVLGELRAAGVLVSIDDFGTGYSSLNYLSELPVDILKMDGLFVRRLGTSLRTRPYAIAETIVAMAHRLELKVIAECVETAEQLADLDAMRCDEAQGYLFHRPLPAEAIGALLACQAAAASAAAVPALA